MAKALVRKLWGHPVDAQIVRLKEYAEIPIRDRDIYVDGRGAESFEALVQSLRPGDRVVYIAADLRVFADGMQQILGKTAVLETKGVRLCDVRDDKATLSQLIDRTRVELAKNARKMTGKEAERTGRKGGIQKRKAYEVRRAEAAPPDLIQRIVDHPKLTWRVAAELLGPPFSVASLRRHFPRSK